MKMETYIYILEHRSLLISNQRKEPTIQHTMLLHICLWLHDAGRLCEAIKYAREYQSIVLGDTTMEWCVCDYVCVCRVWRMWPITKNGDSSRWLYIGITLE